MIQYLAVRIYTISLNYSLVEEAASVSEVLSSSSSGILSCSISFGLKIEKLINIMIRNLFSVYLDDSSTSAFLTGVAADTSGLLK